MKKLLVIDNGIEGIPNGRHEVGNLIIYSGEPPIQDRSISTVYWNSLDDYGKKSFNDQLDEPQRKIAREAAAAAEADAGQADAAYVYVGTTSKHIMKRLIENLKVRGILVHMVACDCSWGAKVSYAKELGIEITMCECGGSKTFKRLVADLT